MAKLHAHLSYANTMSTIAVFLALGGGAFAASGGLLAPNGNVRVCVPAGGGVARVVHPHSKCEPHTATLVLITSASGALKRVGPTGPRGSEGPRGFKGSNGSRGGAGAAGSTGAPGSTGATGSTGASGAIGASGATGPVGASGYSFSLGPVGEATTQTVAASFAGEQMQLVCAAGTCTAQVTTSIAATVIGTDVRGPNNAAPTSTVATYAATPAPLTAIAGNSMQSEARATLSVSNGTAWQIDVELVSDGAGNVHLTGTAIPANVAAS